MSDLRRDPLYNTLNEFDFIVFVQLETELFHTEFQVNVPTTQARLVTVTVKKEYYYILQAKTETAWQWQCSGLVGDW